jgi:hypothetical protein
MQEYPKALYLNGEYRVVANADAEAMAKEEGYTGWHSDQEKMNSGEPKEAGEPEVKPKRAYNRKAA